MILSHSFRFIAFKTRKTAGTSFEIILSKYMAAQDIVTPIAPDDEKIRSSLGYTGPQNFETGLLDRPRFHNHIEAGDVRAMVPTDVFHNYLKVAIVRNPFDYVVSWYFWERSRAGATSREDFRNWLQLQFHRRPEIEAQYRQKLRPNPGVFSSNRCITHIDGNCVMDMMLRYEKLQEDAARFAAQVGLPALPAGDFEVVRAKGSYRPAAATPQHMFEGFSEGQYMVRSVFAQEIDRFGYELA